MLQNSKSIYFIKRLFTFVDEKNKLDIIKYNKNMQKILDISLINYKTFSGRYILYGKNGKGKEYNYDDKLLFEGEYLNRKRNGKGKEYNDYNGKLMFEGEYLNKKRNGKGKEYGEYCILIFEGEYINGKRNGKGKEYNYGELIFEGEYKEGERLKGKEFDYFW